MNRPAASKARAAAAPALSNRVLLVSGSLLAAAAVAFAAPAAFAQSHSSSRYSYRQSTPAEQHSWYDRGNTDFNS